MTGPAPAGARFTTETILALHHWTPVLLSIRTSRPPAFRFKPGHYARLGLAHADRGVVWRPFSMVSAPQEQHLEFFAVLVPGGDFSASLSQARLHDPLFIDKASYGFMTLDGVAPGRDLWLLASGTGLGPFLSILREPATWQAFENLVLVQSVRHAVELAYGEEINRLAHDEPFASLPARLNHVRVVTREPWAGALDARIPQLIEDGRLERSAGLAIDPRHSRILVCGNPAMNRDLRAQLTARGFRTSRRNAPGQLAFENYWQDPPAISPAPAPDS